MVLKSVERPFCAHYYYNYSVIDDEYVFQKVPQNCGFILSVFEPDEMKLSDYKVASGDVVTLSDFGGTNCVCADGCLAVEDSYQKNTSP